MSKLIIVESPEKAKTIKKYLGSGYDIVASKGHIRDLPAAKLSVDVKNNFEPKYAVIKEKEKLVKELQDKVKKSDFVYLAADPDREIKSKRAILFISRRTRTVREKRFRGIWRRFSALTLTRKTA